MVFQEPASLSQFQILQTCLARSNCCPGISFQLADRPVILAEFKLRRAFIFRVSKGVSKIEPPPRPFETAKDPGTAAIPVRKALANRAFYLTENER